MCSVSGFAKRLPDASADRQKTSRLNAHTTMPVRRPASNATARPDEARASHPRNHEMPPFEAFSDAESQCATGPHELTHRVKAPARLDRNRNGLFPGAIPSKLYATRFAFNPLCMQEAKHDFMPL